MAKELFFDYVEFGKIFNEGASSDFAILDYSSALAKEQAGLLCLNYEDALKSPALYRSTFFQRLGNVSVCLLSMPSGMLFCQIQLRQEGEYAIHLGNQERVNRPYAQVRYVKIDDEKQQEIIQAFRAGLSPYSALLYRRRRDEMILNVQEEFALKDYIAEGGERPWRVVFERALCEKDEIRKKAKQLTAFLLSLPGRQEGQWKTRVIGESLSLLEKIQVIELAQQQLLPLTGGLFSFALDYVSDSSSLFIKFYGGEQGDASDKRPTLNLGESPALGEESVLVLEQYNAALESIRRANAEKAKDIEEKVGKFFRQDLSLEQSIRLVQELDKEEKSLAQVVIPDIQFDAQKTLEALWRLDSEKIPLLPDDIVKNEKVASFLFEKNTLEALSLLAKFFSNSRKKISTISADVNESLCSLEDEKLEVFLLELKKNKFRYTRNFIQDLSSKTGRLENFFRYFLPSLYREEKAPLVYDLVAVSDSLFKETEKDDSLESNFLNFAVRDPEVMTRWFQYRLRHNLDAAIRLHEKYIRAVTNDPKAWTILKYNALTNSSPEEFDALWKFYQWLPDGEKKEETFWRLVGNFPGGKKFREKIWRESLLKIQEKDAKAKDALRAYVSNLENLLPYDQKGKALIETFPNELIMEFGLIKTLIDKKEFNALYDFIEKFNESGIEEYKTDLLGLIKSLPDEEFKRKCNESFNRFSPPSSTAPELQQDKPETQDETEKIKAPSSLFQEEASPLKNSPAENETHKESKNDSYLIVFIMLFISVALLLYGYFQLPGNIGFLVFGIILLIFSVIFALNSK